MEKGDKIRYTGKHDGAKVERNGQEAEVINSWPDYGRSNTACAMVRFPDGFEFPVYQDECEVIKMAPDSGGHLVA